MISENGAIIACVERLDRLKPSEEGDMKALFLVLLLMTVASASADGAQTLAPTSPGNFNISTPDRSVPPSTLNTNPSLQPQQVAPPPIVMPPPAAQSNVQTCIRAGGGTIQCQ
jgi:hypothetical protein